jgi:hypothetical protein
MFSFIGFIFLTIKIALLTGLYTWTTVKLLRLLNLFHKPAWLAGLMSNLGLFRVVSGVSYFALLFWYAFSYWGYRGLGDYARIPAGNGYSIEDIDGTMTWIEPPKKTKGTDIQIANFALAGEYICAEVRAFDSSDCQACYIVSNTKTHKNVVLLSADAYAAYADAHKLPHQSGFKGFFDHYREHWGGIKAYLLP